MDYDTEKFAQVLSDLEETLPISSEYDKHHGQENAWWESQRQHMVDWFQKQNTLGEGHYTRGAPNTSARIAYNNLKCPGALLWMAEALGEEKETLENAKNAAIMEPNKQKRFGIIRGYIPWTRIVELCGNKNI